MEYPELNALISTVLRRMRICPADRDDVRQHLFVAALKALRRHDPARGASVRTFLRTRLIGAARDYLDVKTRQGSREVFADTMPERPSFVNPDSRILLAQLMLDSPAANDALPMAWAVYVEGRTLASIPGRTRSGNSRALKSKFRVVQ